MKNYAVAINRLLASKVSNLQKRDAVGLDWLREKVLKHDRSTGIKQYRLFGEPLYYTSAVDLLHSLEELFVEEVYKADLGPAPYIIDCGANIGLSVLYLKRAHPDATILAFEPDTVNFSLLQKNIQSYGLQGVEPQQKAIWNKDTTLNFSGGGNLASSISQTEKQGDYEVAAVRLGAFIDKKVDFLKIDIEGAEYEVIRDIQDKLQLVDRLFLEYHSTFADCYKLVELLDIVTKAGFSFYLKEGLNIYPKPFARQHTTHCYDVQLNIFCFRQAGV